MSDGVNALNLKSNENSNDFKQDASNIKIYQQVQNLHLTQQKPEVLYEFYINDNGQNDFEYHFNSNKVDTTKYNCITFLPKALLFQFMRLANVYFLLCAIIQSIPIISPLGAASAVLPLIVVLSVSLLREAYEDLNRRKLDNEQNSEIVNVYRDNRWEKVKSGDLRIGEVIEVKKDCVFPADLVLLDSQLSNGVCFIETGSLDGEKTLKMKNSFIELAGRFNIEGERISSFSIEGKILCDEPNAELYQLNGKMDVRFSSGEAASGKHQLPLESKQLLLRGAKLRNTQWILGIIIYTGHNCKIMKNSKEPRVKYSNVESLLNKALIFILIVQSILCIICAVLRGVYYKENLKNNEIFNQTEFSYGVEGIITYLAYILLLNTMIPISLIITLEIIKLIQGWLMSIDVEGYSKIRKKFIKPNSVSLNEELGVVNYIFTDKTGTLTCNKMMFKYCVIGDICYEFIREEDSEKNKILRENEGIIPFNEGEMYISTKDETPLNKFKYPNFIIKSENDDNCSISLDTSAKLIREFWEALAICNDCTIQESEKGECEYVGMSPDSIELVKSAKLQGFERIESGNSNILRLSLGKDENTKDFEKLELIEFSSDRKRESIIVKDGKLIKLFIKGADSIIEERLSPQTRIEFLQQSRLYVNKFSALGYRTLLIGMKILSQSEYEQFTTSLTSANLDIAHRKEKVAEVYNLIEKNIHLIGATIVEDKLQDQVPETIRDLRLAGIKIWMLTGDKMNTAYNIGLSCNLISKDLKIFKIEGIETKKNEHMNIVNRTEMNDVILKFAKEFQKFKGHYDTMEKPQFSILVDEKALLTISEDEEIQRIFLQIAKEAVAVICCRVSPLQKSQVVKMMKNYEKEAVTLSIGDGGNDVSMIMEAHIGIGIYGEEGMRAVQSGDYALGEFKILHRLLLFHGRVNYIRNSEVVLYFFYKNFVFTLVQFLFGFFSNFSSQTIIDDWFITLYNLIFTSLPLGARACLDFDVKPDDGEVIRKMLPFLYKETRNVPIFTIVNFSLSLAKGTIHCCINFFYVYSNLVIGPIDKSGNLGDLWYFSVNLFSNILLIVTLDLIIFTRYHTWLNFVVILVVTVGAYLVFLVMVHFSSMFNSFASMGVSFSSGVLWLNIIFVSGVCYIIDFAIKVSELVFFPYIRNILVKIVSQRGICDNEQNLPKAIKKKLELYQEYINDEDDGRHGTQNHLKMKTANEDNEFDENRNLTKRNNKNKKQQKENSVLGLKMEE